MYIPLPNSSVRTQDDSRSDVPEQVVTVDEVYI